MTKLTWIILALPVLLMGGCNSSSSGSSGTSKNSIYVPVFKDESLLSSPAVAHGEAVGVVANLSTDKFNAADYELITKVGADGEPNGFYEHRGKDKTIGDNYYDAISVLVASTETTDKYVYILGRIDQSAGPAPNLAVGPVTYRGDIEYYDPEIDPDLKDLKAAGTFELTRTFDDPKGTNSISLDWNGDGTNVTTAPVTDHPKHKDIDFLFSEPTLNLEGHGTFYNGFKRVYGLFKSTNYAGGFKGACGDPCPIN